MRFAKFLSSAGTNFCDWERLVFSLEINFFGSRQNRKNNNNKNNNILRFVCLFVVVVFFRVHAFKIQLNQNAVLKNVTQCQSMTNTSRPVVADFSGKSLKIGSNYGTTCN